MSIIIKGTVKQIHRESCGEIAVTILTEGECVNQGQSEVVLQMDESRAKQIHLGDCTITLEMLDG